MLNNVFKNTVLTVIVLAVLSTAAFSEELYAKRVKSLEKNLIENPKSETDREEYIKLLSKHAKSCYSEKDYVSSADDLRSILFFMRGSKNVKECTAYKKRLAKALEKTNFEYSSENRLEIAKNLYLEGKYFASSYEFLSLLEEGYNKAVCYEYLGDISQKVDKKPTTINLYRLSLKEEANPRINFKLAKLYDSMSRESAALDNYSTAIQSTTDTDILEEIADIFTAKINKSPKNSIYYEMLGQTYQELGQYDRTYPLYQKAIALNPADISLKYLSGTLMHEMGQYSKAIEIYNSILRSNPYESQIRIAKAKCLIALKKANEALKEYQIVLAIYPNSVSAKYAICKLLYPQKGILGAVKEFYPLEPDFQPDSEFYLELARLLDKMGDYKMSIDAYTLAVSKDKKNEKAYVELYELYYAQNNQAKAYELLQEAYANLPNNPKIKNLYASLNKDSTLKKNSLALSYIENKQYAKAIMIYEQINPKTAEVYASMANCYKMDNKLDEAIKYMNEAIKLNPADSDLYYNLALVYIDKKNFNAAQANLTKAVGLNRDNVKAIKLSNYVAQKNVADILNKAYASYEAGKFDEARVFLAEGQKAYPYDAQLDYYTGLTYDAQKKYPEAIESYQTALKKNQNFDLAYFAIAQVLERYGKGREALEAYERFLGGDYDEDREVIKQAQERVIELSNKYY